MLDMPRLYIHYCPQCLGCNLITMLMMHCTSIISDIYGFRFVMMCIRGTVILGNIIVETSDAMLPYCDYIWVQIANWWETYIGPNFPNEDAAHVETTLIRKCSEPLETYFVELAWEYFTCRCWNELPLKLIFFSVWKHANHTNIRKYKYEKKTIKKRKGKIHVICWPNCLFSF
jgi:hypothetical protein